MSTFALVHGSSHGGWCWDRLRPGLEALGHRVVTMDLPIDNSSAFFDDYANTVCAAVAEVPGDDLVLVGHSLAGATIALVAGRRPLQHLVYLRGVPPTPGRPFLEQLAEETDMLHPAYTRGLSDKDSQGRRRWIDEKFAQFHLFGDYDDATAASAFARLRPQSSAPYMIPCASPAYPTVRTTYVVCDEDRMVNPAWSRLIAREWLDADLVEMPGGHSPYLSRPADLAEVLDRVSVDRR